MSRRARTALARSVVLFVATFLFSVACLVIAEPRLAFAQATTLNATTSARQVEVGEELEYSLQVMATDGSEPADPQPGAIAGFTVVRTASMPFRMGMNINGRQTSSIALTTTWVLRAERAGTFTLGPASIVLRNGRKSADAVRVTVVPRGSQPRNPNGRRHDRQDPFGLPPSLQGLFQLGDDHDSLDAITSDPRYALEQPRDTGVFLHAIVDKSRALVGEQVTLSVLRYEDPRVRASAKNQHEPSAPDFVRYSLMREREMSLGTAMVGGRAWSVTLVHKAALFPLKAGRLTISPMSFTVPQARVPIRESEALTVDVTEPPIAGRPAGYQLGDVGDYSLSATVTPRSIAQGGAIGVSVELRGTGNLPAQLPTPVLPGIEWLNAQTADALGPMQNDRLGGSRTFSYVVRLNRAGDIDLGEIRIPYYDPTTRAYNVARAALGIVNVTPGAVSSAVDAGPDPVETILPDLPKERRALEGVQTASFVADRSVFWIGLLAAPMLAVCATFARSAVRTLRERRKGRAPTDAEVARDRRTKAEAALRGTDAAGVVSAAAKALEAEVLVRTRVNVRGTSTDGAIRELTDAGVSPDAAREIMAALAACEDARFSPEGVSLDDAKRLAERTKAASRGLDSVEAAEEP